MDWDEELKRQAAISALLAQQPELEPLNQPEIIKPEDKSDYHKLVDSAFSPEAAADIPTIEQPTVPAGHIDLAPPGHIDLAPPQVPTTQEIRTDPETGTRFAIDKDSGQMVPRAELATLADEQAFKPSLAQLPQLDVTGEVPVARGTLVKLPTQFDESMTPSPSGRQEPVATALRDRDIQDRLAQIGQAQLGAAAAPEVRRAQIAAKELPSGPKAPGTHTELAPPGQMDLRPDEAVPRAAVEPKPADQGTPGATQAMTVDEIGKWFDDQKSKPTAADISQTRVVLGRDLSGTDGRITDILSHAAQALPAGYTITATSGVRTSGQGQHTVGKAQDWQIVGPDGQPIKNRGDDESGLYTLLARNAYGYQEKYYPELTGQFQWGGQFGTSASNPDEPDLMHFDIGGRRGRIERYSRENIGAVLPNVVTEQPKDVVETLDSQLGGLLQNKGAVFAEMGAKYGVDPKLIAAIAMEETTNGTSHLLRTRNNIGGLTGPGHTGENGDYMPYDTLDEGIEAVARNLRARYLDQGLTTIDQIGAVWAPVGAKNDPQGTNHQWPGAVAKFYTQLGGSGNLEGASAQQEKQPWDDWVTLSPEEQATAEAAGQKRNIAVLDKLNQSTQNPGEFWRKISQHIEGVPDDLRQAYADNFKKEVVKYAQDFYGEKDPEKAFARATSDPGFEAYVSNIGRGLAGAVGQADVGISLMGKNIDNNRVDGFAKLIHPESTGEGRAGFIKTLTDIQDTRHRHDVFNEIYGNLPQVTKDAIGDPASLLDSIDHLASPQYQADLNKAIATKKAWVDQQLQGNPELRGTSAGWWTTGTGENIFNTVAALVPGGIGTIVRSSTFGSQMYSSNLGRIAGEHPDWSSAQVSDMASRSAFMQLAPQEALIAASHGIMTPILKWAGAAAENPVVRFGIGGGIPVAVGAAGAGLGQVGENIAEHKPNLLENVPQAMGMGALQAAPFAVHGGLHGVAERPPVVEPELGVHGSPEEPRTPLPRNAVSGGVETAPERVEPPPVLTPNRAVRASDILGRESGGLEPGGQRAVTMSDVLGTQEGYTPEPPIPWYKEGVTPAQRHDPLVIRGAERTTFTPQELADLVDRAPSGSPADLANFLNRIERPTGLHLGEGSKKEIGRAKVAQEQPSPIQFWKSEKDRARAEQAWIRARGGEPVNVAAEIVKARVAESLGGAIPSTSRVAPPEPAPPPRVSESEPFVSKIANRYTAERMVSGELGQVDPSQGKSTEELIGHGLRMAPNRREGLIDNFVKGKGGDLDEQGAAIRSKEAILSLQSTEAAHASEAEPSNRQLKAQADAALKAVTDFHNGPVKKLKRVWSDAGRGLQREVPLDYTTLNGMKEAYLKGAGNGKEAPPEMEPKLKETAKRVSKSASDEQVAIDNLGKEIEKKTRGKILPNSDQIRAHLMEIMKNLPCRN